MTLAKWLKKFEESKKSSTFAAGTNPVDAMQEKSNADLQRKIKELETALHAEKLKNLALNTLIDMAESQGIQIRKKIWGQAVEQLCERHGLSVSAACKLFGHCRQAKVIILK